jgi:hypothetical protein
MPHVTASYESKVDLDSPRQPAILAGILGISSAYIYQCMQEAKLPTNPQSTYRECIQFYFNYYKQKANTKSSSIAESKMLQDIRNGVAKEELTWLSIKERRGLLLDKQEFSEIIMPIFQLIRSGLITLAREMPETQDKVDAMLRSWTSLGDKLEEEAAIDGNDYVATMLSAEPEVLLKQHEEHLAEQAAFEEAAS